VRDEGAALEVLHVGDLDFERADLLEAGVADVVDLHDELELLVEAARVADDGHGLAPHPCAAASSASSARVSWLMRRMMNSAGLLVARPTRAMSLPAKMTVGVLSCSLTSTKNAVLGVLVRNAPLFICASRKAVMVRRTWARSPSVLFLCRANWSPCFRLRSMKMTPRRSATYGKLPLPLSVREPSMKRGRPGPVVSGLMRCGYTRSRLFSSSTSSVSKPSTPNMRPASMPAGGS